MTDEEAARVAAVLATADGECGHCAHELAKEMAKPFPTHDWLTLVQTAGDWGPGSWKDPD
jgi:hypothetical protein